MLFPLVGLALVSSASAAGRLEVDTTSGTVRGTVNSSHPHVAQYLGVPFAEQPVGSRRWLPPARKAREPSLINATQLPPACSQWSGDEPSIYNSDVRELLIQPYDYQSEACLTLSIWTPVQEKGYGGQAPEKLPVIIWIYGGGFVAGGTDVPYQNPAPWVERSKQHIVVSIQYRVGLFGFPNAKGLSITEQNLGLLDQRAGVEWVRDNIAKFGGDASRMALMGQSAGGMSADYYNFAYLEDPIVSSFILHSGTSHVPINNIDVDQSNFTFIANQLGCNNTDAKAEIDCLRKVSEKDLNAFQKKYAQDGTQPGINSFVPIVDNKTKFADADYTARTLAGKFSRRPALMGNVKDEGAAFVPYNATYGAPRSEIDAATRSFMLCPTVQTARERFASTANVTTFRYLYAGNFTNISPRWWFGAYHSSELPLVFGTYDVARDKGTELEIKVSEKMQDLWVAFVSDPVRGLPKAGWEKYEGGKGSVWVFGDEVVVKKVPENEIEGVCNTSETGQ